MTKRRATGALLLAGALTFLAWPKAHGESAKVKELRLLCESQPARHRKAIAVEALAELGTTEAVAALKKLADSKDERTALAAITALGRHDVSGAETKLKDVLESSTRSDHVRCVALGAYLQLQKDASKTWLQTRGYVAGEADGDAALEDMRDAVAARLWPLEFELLEGGE